MLRWLSTTYEWGVSTKQGETSSGCLSNREVGTDPCQYRDNLDAAVQIFRDRKTLRPELCRVLFKKSMLLDKAGDADTAASNSDECLRVFREIRPSIPGCPDKLEEGNVDDLVAFWSR